MYIRTTIGNERLSDLIIVTFKNQEAIKIKQQMHLKV